MNTPSHMIVGAVAFAREGEPKRTFAAFAGGLAPDVMLLLLSGYTLYVMRIPAGTVFGVYFFSDAWQRIFAIDHSFFVWGIILALGMGLRRSELQAFAGAGLLHCVTDFLLHHDDARRQFWPVSDFVFRSPVSYWDPRYYGAIVAPVEVILVAALTLFLLWRLNSWYERILTLGTSLILIAPVILSGGLHGLHGI